MGTRQLLRLVLTVAGITVQVGLWLVKRSLQRHPRPRW
jgi:hypothetical protein